MKNIKIIIIMIVIMIIFISPAAAFAATLSLDPSSGTFNRSCSFSLGIQLDTQNVSTDGTDAILIFDSARVTAESISNGSIYSDYPGNAIDKQTGKVTISGLASVSSPFSGKGTLATVNFRVADNAQSGATQIKFDFDPNNKSKTTDSNVVERGTVVDVLSSVSDGNYTIGVGTCATASPSPGTSLGKGATGVSTPSATKQPTVTLPAGGTEEFTFTLAIIGVVLTMLGILGLVLL